MWILCGDGSCDSKNSTCEVCVSRDKHGIDASACFYKNDCKVARKPEFDVSILLRQMQIGKLCS